MFDFLNLPDVVNENAVQTLLLNQDRCTKNFLVYYNPNTKEWIRWAGAAARVQPVVPGYGIGLAVIGYDIRQGRTARRCTNAVRQRCTPCVCSPKSGMMTAQARCAVLRRPTRCCCRVPWDVETSFAQDNGLGGAPGPYYCVLACEQWNSPLYCDSEHPQDIAGIQTPWGTVTAVGMNTYQGSAVQRTGRRLAQQAAGGNGTRLAAEGDKPVGVGVQARWGLSALLPWSCSVCSLQCERQPEACRAWREMPRLLSTQQARVR